ncbi:bifunctional DNA-formamidopyrimidine glycosylase/DNA-(apurinic or apyrimidinic site) lyase [Francisellaceae bacterium]|nr:bifunctional DNA-formamidopyrimidine glycosylase/DNA-(apurinic or apyrimidinic site) lyase [Francisellaceae bacterium]
MPELPEVETVKNGLNQFVCNQIIHNVNVYQSSLRYKVDPNIASILKNKVILNLSRRAKYLIFELDKGYIIAHLGMTGIFRVFSNPIPELKKHDHIELILEDCVIRYNDTRRFGFFIYSEEHPDKHKLFVKLGPEPLLDDFNGEYLYEKLSNKNKPIKSTLMDNAIVVGVGNIYANEVLFKCGIHPISISKNISLEQCEHLVSEIKQILAESIKQGGTTLKDFKNTAGKPGYFSQSLAVYGQKNQVCKTCDNIIESTVIGQRSSFFCSECQKVY